MTDLEGNLVEEIFLSEDLILNGVRVEEDVYQGARMAAIIADADHSFYFLRIENYQLYIGDGTIRLMNPPHYEK